jgi:hypothetical protein
MYEPAARMVRERRLAVWSNGPHLNVKGTSLFSLFSLFSLVSLVVYAAFALN